MMKDRETENTGTREENMNRTQQTMATIKMLTQPESGCTACARKQRACDKHANERIEAHNAATRKA